MRDRETDSWWSIMSSDAIGGPLAGHDLPELPYGEKTTFGDWLRRHPDTLVLSVDGKEHETTDHYDEYFNSDETFRDMTVADDRLPAKAPVFSFRLGGTPFAAAHDAFAGGKLFQTPHGRVLLYRETGAHLFASTDGWAVADGHGDDARALIARVAAGDRSGLTPLEGFDTFWYTWVANNEDTRLLR